MFDTTQPIALSVVFGTVAAIIVVVALCIFAVNVKTKRLKEKQ